MGLEITISIIWLGRVHLISLHHSHDVEECKHITQAWCDMTLSEDGGRGMITGHTHTQKQEFWPTLLGRLEDWRIGSIPNPNDSNEKTVNASPPPWFRTGESQRQVLGGRRRRLRSMSNSLNSTKTWESWDILVSFFRTFLTRADMHFKTNVHKLGWQRSPQSPLLKATSATKVRLATRDTEGNSTDSKILEDAKMVFAEICTCLHVEPASRFKRETKGKGQRQGWGLKFEGAGFCVIPF